MFETKFTRVFGVKYPIMQGALGYLSDANLVAAVGNAGGLGTMVTTIAANKNELRDELRKVKSLTDKPYALGLSFLPGNKPVSDEDVLDLVFSEKVPIVQTTSAGKLADSVLNPLKQHGVKIIHKCTKVKHAQGAEAQGVDAVAMIGYGVGGHPGTDEISHMVQIPKAASVLKIPVIASGCIADGRGFVAALALGADAVLMGTRFLVAEECPAHRKLKEWMVEAEETDTVLVDNTHGFPARSIKNKNSAAILELEKQGAPLEEIIKLRSGLKASRAWRDGDIDGGSFGCGQVIGLIDEVLPAREIIERTIREAQEIIARLGRLAKN